jgi:hypothetical protein
MVDVDNFFMIRDEIIDCKDDVDDFLVDTSGQNMHDSVSRRLSNALELIENLRNELGIPDREYTPDH